MRLRQITQHVKGQNWFAVALDFFIVVVGILIAFQITNWSEARQNIKAERQILERLHEEVQTAMTTDLTFREAIYDRQLANMETARHVIFDVSERTELTSNECQAIALSHQPLLGPVSIPILNELSATGDIALIRNKEIVRAISEVKDASDNAYIFLEGMLSRTVILSRQFPDFITMTLEQDAQVQLQTEIDAYDPFYSCDSEKMRNNPVFRNTAGENITNSFALLEISIIPLREALTNLNTELETALSLNAKP